MKSNFVLSGIIFLSSAGIICGCSEIEEQQFAPVEGKSRISATIADAPEGRTMLVDGGKIAWEDSDKIGVFTPGAVQVPFQTERIEGGSATFVSSYSIDMSAETFYAVFPYDEANSLEDGTLNFVLPSVQNYRETGFASTANPMAAAAAEPRFKFRNLCGVLQLNLTGSTVVSKVVFTSKRGPAVSGAGYVDFGNPDAPVFVPAQTAEKSVTLACGAVVLDEEPAVPFHIVLPAGKYEQFSVTVEDTSGKKITFEGQNLTIKRSVITRTALYCDTGTIIDLNSPVHYGLPEGSAVHANCFIVSRRGTYRFDVADAAGYPLKDAVSVDWVWAVGENWDSDSHTCDELIQNVKFDTAAQEIEFSVTENYSKGNVLLAAFDAQKHILWSWHIWITSKPEECETGGVVVLDRNLGATTSQPGENASIGLLYQWGRKDPFPGAFGVGTDTSVSQEVKSGSTNTSFTAGTNPSADTGYTSYYIINTGTLSEGTQGWNGAYSSLGNELTALGAVSQNITDYDAAKFPTTFFHAASYMPNYSGGQVAAWTSYATANPCPYGYALPTKEQIEAVLGADYTNCSFVSNDGRYGINAGSAWLPCTGYRSGGTGGNAGTLRQAGYTGRYWSASSAKNTTGVWYYFEPSKESLTIGDGNKLHGAAIRCVKIAK